MSTRKIISYVVPLVVEHGTTSLGQQYEVNFENGVKVLNSEHANYSFGSLHTIMQKGITLVLKDHKPSNILMLGLGAGSALAILAARCKWPYRVTVVEIDPDLIGIARKHFNLDAHSNTAVICGDASKVIRELKPESFDLIIDDIFWDDKVPAFCLGKPFLQDNNRLLSANGIYLRNVMNASTAEIRDYENNLASSFGSFKNSKHTEFNNKIYICRPQPQR